VIGGDGEFCQRLTHGSVFDHWCEVDEVPLGAGPGERVSILAQAWASNLDGVDRPMDPDWSRGDYKGKHAGILRRAEVVEVRPGVRALLHDIEVLLGLARRCPEYAVRRKRILRARRFVHVLAWDINGGIDLVRDSGRDDGYPHRLADFLYAALDANPDLEIRILLWDYSMPESVR